jgi:hypothetical protein
MKTKKKLAIIITSLVLALVPCLVASAAVSSVTPGGEPGITPTGTMIAKIGLIALVIFMVLLSGYFALRKKEVKA